MVKKHLPTFIRAIKQNGHPVVWSCDPMHGNTYATGENVKTRSFNDILREIRETFEVHAQKPVILAEFTSSLPVTM
jgi:3-deoxy-7-phosphoheptulonate synthase